MQALRTLPILNRPSRPSSPAPPSTQTTNATALAPSVAGTAITHTASEPGKPRSRSLSRQVVDRVSSMHPPAVPASAQVVPNGHALPSQPVTGVKKASPPNSRPATPRTAQTPIPGENGAPQTGYMDVLGLRLNEAVNKASAGVDYKAKKPFKKGSGWNVGESVVKELPYPPNDAYLIRAVLRTAVRSLSIYITRLESLLLPALTDVAFNAPLNLSLPTLHSHPLNPTQYYALSVAHAAWETCEVLEQTLETGKWPRFVNETLRPVMDKLDLVVGKVVQPLLLGLKRDLVASLSRTEGLSPNGSKPIALAHTPATPNVPVTKEGSNAGIARLTKPPSGSGATRQASLPVPIMLQHFASRVDAARKVLEIVAGPCADDGEGWITGVVVAVIWKGMCVVSERDTGATSARPPSPSSVSKALNGLKLEKEGGAPTPTASLGGVTAKFTTILPSRAASRPPSPSRHSTRWDPMTHALMSLEGLVKRLITGLVEPCLAPTHQDPSVPLEPEHIAREALFEAFEALVSFRQVSTAMHGRNSSTRILASSRRIRDDVDDDDEEALDDAMEDMPSITLFTILLRQANVALGAIPEIMSEKSPYPTAGGPLKLRSPAEIWSWSVVEYERQALQGGFGQAEEWGKRVAMGIKADVERTLLSLGGLVAAGIGSTGEKTGLGKEVVEAQEWVRALGVACEARCGVKVVGAT